VERATLTIQLHSVNDISPALASDFACNTIKIDDYACRKAFRHFMNLLNRAVYGAAFRRYNKSLRVLPVLEEGEVGALRTWEHGTSGRWHVHCAIELPLHLDAIAFEKLIRQCWASNWIVERLYHYAVNKTVEL
jgi:hypothetical protein